MVDLAAPWPSATGYHKAQAGFLARFGHRPAAVYSAPGRVNLIGEHTDYNQGPCLPIALPHRTFVALSPITYDAVALASASASPWVAPLSAVTPGRLTGWGCYPAGVAWALARQGLAVGGFRGFVSSCVPLGAGLSSSAALECAFALGLNDLATQPWPDNQTSRHAMAKAATAAENLIAGAATGEMDQVISLLAQKDHALLVDFGPGKTTQTTQTTQVPFDLAWQDLALLVIDTKASHQLADGQYATRRAQCEAAAHQLGVPALGRIGIDQMNHAWARLDNQTLRRRTRHVVSETHRVYQCVQALEQGDFRRVGKLFDASHASLRDDYQVSCPELDLAVETAKAGGALGARMTGGGFGGSAIALVKATEVQAIADQLIQAFAKRGYNQPGFLLAQPSGPARRE